MPNPAAYTAIRSYKKNRTANKPSYFHSPEIQALFAKCNAARRQGRIRPECRNEIHPNLRLIQIYEEFVRFRQILAE